MADCSCDREYLLALPPGSPLALVTETHVINLTVTSVRERTAQISKDDIPEDASVLGVAIEPQAQQP